MQQRFFVLKLPLVLLVLGTLVSCATVTYPFPSERPAGVTFKSVKIFYREPPIFGLSPWTSPIPPVPEDLVLLKKELGTRDWAQVVDLVNAAGQNPGGKTETVAAAVNVFRAAVLADHQVLFRGEAQFDGKSVPIEVLARVLDLATEREDPTTRVKTRETPFTRSTISEIVATSGGQSLFALPRTLPTFAPMFPFVLLQTTDQSSEVVLTTLETLEEKESPNRNQHGLVFNLKRRAQVFEVRDSQQQLVASFDADTLTYRTDAADPAALKVLAAGVLALRELITRFYLADEVLVRYPTGTIMTTLPTKTTPVSVWTDRGSLLSGLEVPVR